jgi:hypothetical protein
MDVKSGPSVREEHRLKVFKNRVLRKLFGPKSQEAKSRLENTA